MAKIHPDEAANVTRLDDRKGIKEFTADLTGMIRKDESDRSSWLDAKIEAYQRRYAASAFDKPQVNFPWIGASSIDSGLSDIHIEELKPSLMNLVFGGRRIYEMMPMNADAVPAAAQANMAMDSLLKYRIPDYTFQMAWGIDSLGTYGIKTDKVFYSYVTEQGERSITRANLPPRLAKIAVFTDLTKNQREIAAQMGVILMTRKEFDQNKKEIEDVVLDEFGLDRDERVDRVALAEVMRFLRNGTGESTLTTKYRRVVEDTPRIINVPIENVVVPIGTRCIEEAERICHWMFFSESEMRQRARDNVWDDKAVKMVLDSGSVSRSSGAGYDGGQMLHLAKMDRTRLYETGPDRHGLFRVAEVHCKWDIDNDGLDERVVITYDPTSGAILKAIPWTDEVPFTDTFLEATDQERHASRGVPELISDMERHASALMRAEHNNLLIETSRSFTYVENSGIDPMSSPWMPGLMWPVQNHNDLQPIDMAPRALALQGPMQQLMSMAERRISGSNRAALDLPPPERRTAAEIGTFESARQRVMTVRATLFQEGQKRNGRLIWNLWRKYGPDEYWSFVTGQPPIRQTQNVIKGEFSVLPVGAAGDTDPEFRAQRAMQRLQVAMQMHQLLVDDPRYQDDLAQAYVDWLNENDPLAAQRLIRPIPPEQQQAILQRQQQVAQRQAQLADTATAFMEGAPVDEQQAITLLTAIRKMAPHKELQQIIGLAKQAEQVVNRTQNILGPQNGAASGAPQ